MSKTLKKMEESSKLDNQDISRLSVDSIFFKLNGNFFKKKKKGLRVRESCKCLDYDLFCLLVLDL